jgi:hypothetical protein
MAWAIIKRKLRGLRFPSETELFGAVSTAWDETPQATIDCLLSSFRARLKVCVTHQCFSLNGHWREVHALHPANDPSRIEAEAEFE